MKTNSMKKLLAFVLVLCLAVLIVPVFVTPASAETKTYVLDTTADLTAMAAGAKADGDVEKAGTDEFFTIHYSAKTKIDSSNKEYEDGYTATQRLNFGGKMQVGSTTKNTVSFTVDGKATVKIWWTQGGDDHRQMGILDSAGALVTQTEGEYVKNDPYLSTLEIPAAGTYYLGGLTNNNNLHKIEVTVEAGGATAEPTPDPAPTELKYVLDATADITAFAQGEKADGDFEKAGTEQFFTIHYSAKTKVDASSKTFEDTYTATQRINMGGKTDFTAPLNAIEFTTEGPATVKVWWVSGGDGRTVDIYKAEGTLVEAVGADSVKNSLYISTFELAEGGKYYLGSSVGSNYYFKVEVTVPVPAEPVINNYVLDATADITAFAQGEKADGDFEKAGTEQFFTIHYSAKTKVDASTKTFEDEYTATQRINMGGKTDFTAPLNAIEFTTEGTATVKVWWVSGGDGRTVDICKDDGTPVESVGADSVKNSLYISTFELAEGGKYYLGSSIGSNYYFKVEVTVTTGGTVEKPERADWAGVAAPVISGVVDNGDGSVTVTVSALVGYDGADEVNVKMLKNGEEIASKRSIAEKSEHTITFNPDASGTYSFVPAIVREGETDKVGTAVEGAFVYPLGAPVLVSATSKGNGALEVIFSPVKEATAYEVLVDGEVKATVTETTVMLEGLEVGKQVTVTVNAVRGEEKKASATSLVTTVTAEARQTWGFTVYGPSTNLSNNGYTGSVNEDGTVTVYSEGGKGKIQPTSVDGIAFYYTAVPNNYNFTLRATVTVDSWTFSNGQEGFGLMATDRIGVSGDGSDFWNNSYLVGSTKIEYRYDSENEKIYDISDPAAISFPKYSMKQGLGIVERTGVTLDNLAMFEKNDTNTIQQNFVTVTKTFETTAGYYGMEAGTYNVIGNATKDVAGTLEDRFLMTTFVLEIQRNNTGYFLSYYDTEGNLICCEKFYETDALSKLDPDNVYVGFFASRNARATFSDITFNTVLASEDAPAEERPITLVKPSVTISSPTVTTDLEYVVEVDTNVNGTLKISLNGKTVAEGVPVTGLVRFKSDACTLVYGENNLIVTFTPDPDQDLGEYTKLETTDNQSVSTVIMASKGFYHNKVVYVSPTGLPNGNGTKEYPLDIYTAVDSAIPGQTIVIMEGTYLLDKTVKIQRGMDGTAEKPIKMIADPEAKSRPVFDFQGLVAGIVHGGDYWYFAGFDVTRSANMQKGFQVSGNHNTLDNIHTYYNGNTGIQISRYAGADLYPDWPAYNLILNCTSWCNYDLGFEDADGFAAKLTVGDGNVFDGCVAYNNADDGWDLYAKVETGPIGSVTIRNCVAYANGFVPGIDGKTGNGNGFKMGGSSITGKHQLINSYAFFNLSKGIDSNSCPDIIVENCISYNNGSYNCAFYTNAGADTAFVASGIISFKDGTLTEHVPSGDVARAEQLKGKGTQVAADYINDSTYYWDGTDCKNSAGAAVTADMFVSLVFDGIERNADGTINMKGFLELKDNAPSNAGARPDGIPSYDNSVLPEGDEHVFSDAWVTTDVENHWHECECGFMTDIGKHEYEYVIEVMPTETTSGWKHRECKVCGKRGTRIEIYWDEFNPDPEPEPTPDPAPAPSEDNGPKPVVVVLIVVASVLAVGGIGFVVWKFVLHKIKK